MSTGAADAVMIAIEAGCVQGWLRPLDLALVRFLRESDAQMPAAALAAAALASQAEGQGHPCLDLDAVHADQGATLLLPAEAAPLLQALGTGSEAWAAMRRSAVVATPDEAAQPAPLMLDASRLYLRRYWDMERRVAAALRSRLHRLPQAADDAAVARWIQRLFGAPASGDGPDAQRIACERATRRGLTVITGGPGTGKTTTATRLLMLLELLQGVPAQPPWPSQPQPRALRIGLAAPTGKAAARLRESLQAGLGDLRGAAWLADVDSASAADRGPWQAALERLAPVVQQARTLHALLGSRPQGRGFRHDRAHPLPLDLLLVDEASMVHLELMDALLAALPPHARLVLLGDRDQLASVEAGAVLGEWCAAAARVGAQEPAALAEQTVQLTRSHRFQGPIAQLAAAVRGGDASAADAALAGVEARWQSLSAGGFGSAGSPASPAAPGGAVSASASHPEALGAGYAAYAQVLAERPADEAAFEGWAWRALQAFARFRVLAVLRDGPWGVGGLNERFAAQVLGRSARGAEWVDGRPVLVTRNAPALGLANGDIGLVLRRPAPDRRGRADPASRWVACFARGEGLQMVSVSRLPPVETAFAMTVHKSQGSEFDEVLLVLPPPGSPLLTRELLYTGITRARQRLVLAGPDRAALAQALTRHTRRYSGLADLLYREADPVAG